MIEPCNDSRMQDLLHAYELGMVSDEEKDLFEAHLLECEFCFQQVKQFMPRGAMLTDSARLKQQLADSLPFAGEPQESIWRKLAEILWPKDLPVILKPGLLAVVLLLLVYPAYLGIRGDSEDQVLTVREIGLMQTRSQETFVIDIGQTVVISFLSPTGGSDSVYSVVLSEMNGSIIYSDTSFTGVDNFGVGRLMVPGRLIRDGAYKLTVRPNVAVGTARPQFEYVFHVQHLSPQK